MYIHNHNIKINLKLHLQLILLLKFPMKRIFNSGGKTVGQISILFIENGFSCVKWAFHSKVEAQMNVSFPKQSIKIY